MDADPKEALRTFLARIGPRPLTEAEAHELHRLRIRAGETGGFGGMARKLAERAGRETPQD